MLAAEVLPTGLDSWAIGLVLTGVVSVLGFLARNAVASVEHGIEALNAKMDSLRASIAQGDGDRRVLEVRVAGIEREVEQLRRDVREASEGATR